MRFGFFAPSSISLTVLDGMIDLRGQRIEPLAQRQKNNISTGLLGPVCTAQLQESSQLKKELNGVKFSFVFHQATW
jgi:hypothetical protein